ncbi:Hypothetical_protein [Hexamita inflata]|uniref:Hypothetical_protein n=1 Tax=Hexamita inflata TaxID=28002 RepID=A0AA86PPN1_9EUKA|nr:Hypothetical protein HINF_LOCUS30071 [Hexamita inflata]
MLESALNLLITRFYKLPVTEFLQLRYIFENTPTSELILLKKLLFIFESHSEKSEINQILDKVRDIISYSTNCFKEIEHIRGFYQMQCFWYQNQKIQVDYQSLSKLAYDQEEDLCVVVSQKAPKDSKDNKNVSKAASQLLEISGLNQKTPEIKKSINGQLDMLWPTPKSKVIVNPLTSREAIGSGVKLYDEEQKMFFDQHKGLTASQLNFVRVVNAMDD